MTFRINGQSIQHPQFIAGERIEGAELIDFVSPQLNSETNTFISGVHFDRVTAHTERAPAKIEIVSLIEDLNKLRQNLPAGHALSFFEHEQHAVIRFG